MKINHLTCLICPFLAKRVNLFAYKLFLKLHQEVAKRNALSRACNLRKVSIQGQKIDLSRTN